MIRTGNIIRYIKKMQGSSQSAKEIGYEIQMACKQTVICVASGYKNKGSDMDEEKKRMEGFHLRKAVLQTGMESETDESETFA